MRHNVTAQDGGLRAQLAAFGLSEKEIETYVTLLQHGETKASVIAENAGVSKRYVYNVLGSFEERGFVEVNDHETPATVRAVEPSKVIAHFEDQLASMEQNLEAQYNPEPETDREYEVIKSTATVRKRVRDLLGEAENEVNLAVPASFVPDIKDELIETLERGILTLVQVDDDGTGAVDERDLHGLGSAVRYWDEQGPLLMTVDRRFGLFSPDDVVRGGETEKQAINFVEDRLTPVVVGSFIGNYWPSAREVYVHDPFEPPHEYERFRHAVFDATLHQRRGHTLVADLEVRPTDAAGGDYETLRGEITRIRQGIVEPMDNTIPIEHGFVVDTGERAVTVGGPGAFKEQYEARSVELDVVTEDRASVEEMIARSSKLGDEDG